MNRIRLSLALFSCLFSGGILAQYTPGNSQSANKILETGTGNFAIFGAVGDSAAIFGIENCTNVVQFQNFVSSTGGKSSFEDAVEAGNGDFWALGSCTNCAGADPSKKWLLSRFQSSGFLISSQYLGTPNVDCEGNAIASTTTGGMILGGVFEEIPSLILLDASGATLWTQSYPFATADTIGYIHDVIQTPDGGFAFVGWERNVLTNQQWLMTGKTDANGILEWRTKYANNANFPNETRAVQMRANGNLAITGSIYTTASLQMDMFVVQVDINDGTGYQGSYFGTNETEIGMDLTPNPDGSWLLATAQSSANSWSPRSLILRKLNASFVQVGIQSYSFPPFQTNSVSVASLSNDGQEYIFAQTLSLGYWSEAQILRNNVPTCGDTASFFIQAAGGGGGMIIISDDIADLMSIPLNTCLASNIPVEMEDDMADCLLENGVSIENPLLELRLYPNPIHQFFQIENLPETAEVAIFSLQGVPISFQRENEKFTLANISKGIYLLRITTGLHQKQFLFEVY